MGYHRLLVATLVVCGLISAPSAVSAKTYSASAGNVSATLSYTGTYESYSAMNVHIDRAGAPFDPQVAATDCQAPYCGPGYGESTPLKVADLDADGEPEVIVSLYTGGAHCCSIADVFRFDGTQYVERPINFGNPSYRLKRLTSGGVPVFVTADNRFAYRFASYAASGLPIRILRFQTGGLRDVTQRFPGMVKRDAKRWWRYWKSGQRTVGASEARGLLAAWVADQYRVRHRRSALRTLRVAAARGELVGGHKWITRIDEFLRRLGYTR